MASCLLFHGPGARQHAIEEAGRRGSLLHEPFDGELRVDDARLFVSLMRSVPIGTEVGVLVAGPMDRAPPRSSDVLLKAIEEPSEYVHPILWAHDLGGVRPTIRSRCLDQWVAGTGFEPGDEQLESTARELLHAALQGHLWEVPALVARMKSTKGQPGREAELVAEVAEAMSAQVLGPNPPDAVLALWKHLREVARWRNPTQIEVMAAFLSAGR